MQGILCCFAPVARYGSNSAAFKRYIFRKETATNDPKIPSLKFCAAITSQPARSQTMHAGSGTISTAFFTGNSKQKEA